MKVKLLRKDNQLYKLKDNRLLQWNRKADKLKWNNQNYNNQDITKESLWILIVNCFKKFVYNFIGGK